MTQTEGKKPDLYVALPPEGDFGWGSVARGFAKSFSKYATVKPMVPSSSGGAVIEVPGPAFVCLRNVDFDADVDLRGPSTFAHAVFELEPTGRSKARAAEYDKVLCASSWCRDKCLEIGIHNAEVLIQGIDPALFFAAPHRPERRGFLVFSGGKFEFRKGQDVVIKAMQILERRYDDIFLLTAWHNPWPESMETMRMSPHIRFDLEGRSWEDKMARLYTSNDLSPMQTKTIGHLPHDELRNLFAITDIGVFPNRCEGGTNLVMMEYMACGRPVIGTSFSGHTDVLTENNSFPLTQNAPLRVVMRERLEALWAEPSVDELVDRIDYAYHHREENDRRGLRAAEDMKSFTWDHSARRALSLMGLCGG